MRLPHTAGSVAEVSVNLLGTGDAAAKLPSIEVVPGAPVNIAHNLSGKVHMAGVRNATLSIIVTDQHGNRVADGTGVSFFVSDNLEVVSQDGATTNGETSVVVTGSDFPLDSSINIVVDEVSKEVALNVHNLNVGPGTGKRQCSTRWQIGCGGDGHRLRRCSCRWSRSGIGGDLRLS